MYNDNHIEEHIKNHLTHRTIQPSNTAWDRIEDQLIQNKKINKSRYYLVAASFIGLFTMSILLFQWMSKQNSEENKNYSAQKSIEVVHPADIQTVQIATNLTSAHDQSPKKMTPSVRVDVNSMTKSKNKQASIATTIQNPNLETVHNDPNSMSSVVETGQLPSAKKTEEPRNQNKVNADKLLADIESEASIVQSKLWTNDKNSTYDLDITKLVDEAEQVSRQKFLEKVFKTIQTTSEQVITAINTRNQVK